MRRNPLRRWRRDEDHDQHLKLAWAAADGLHDAPGGELAIERAERAWSRMTKRDRLRARITVSIDSLLHEPADKRDFLASVSAASEIALRLRNLNDHERFVLWSILVAGSSTGEVAKQLGLTPHAVRHVKRRAIRKIRSRRSA